MEPLAIISHTFFRAVGFHKSKSPSPPYGPAPQGSQLITLVQGQGRLEKIQIETDFFSVWLP